ncbi:unnamed protein product [Rotaria magnacalcarata]|uniref:Nudix hydrolase domain-containing protein n=1 Tax=Rotaria magnacalcarata TaxID=392030 RepID=A0A819F9I2_9BILA|nr:unnamed protein product [Rotaria magnacalcarata]
MSKPESAGFIIFRRLEQNPIEYLLLQTPIGKQHWTPPKGKIYIQYKFRKVELLKKLSKCFILIGVYVIWRLMNRHYKQLNVKQEEAGLEKSDFEYYDKFEETITYDCNGRPKSVAYYLGRLRNAEQSIQLSDEHQQLCWSTLEDACRLASHSETQNALRKADEFIQKNL